MICSCFSFYRIIYFLYSYHHPLAILPWISVSKRPLLWLAIHLILSLKVSPPRSQHQTFHVQLLLNLRQLVFAPMLPSQQRCYQSAAYSIFLTVLLEIVFFLKNESLITFPLWSLVPPLSNHVSKAFRFEPHCLKFERASIWSFFILDSQTCWVVIRAIEGKNLCITRLAYLCPISSHKEMV